MKKILKNVQPSIRAYLGLACCYSIIDEQAFNSGWVYDKYIHLEYTSYDSQIKYADYEHYDFVSAQGVFAKSFIEYPYDFCSETILCDYICKMLDEGEYCFALWNETIITNYLYEKQNPGIYEHGCFVYGYDKDKKVFYTQGYFDNENWEHAQIPFEIFYEALSYCPEKGEIALIGYREIPDYKWESNIPKMIRELNVYKRNSKNDCEDTRYDLNAILSFFSNLRLGVPVHVPSLYCIYEHKMLFEKRLDFMKKEGVPIKESDLNKAKELIKISRKVMLLGKYYNSNLQESSFAAMLDAAKKLIELERDFCVGGLQLR